MRRRGSGGAGGYDGRHTTTKNPLVNPSADALRVIYLDFDGVLMHHDVRISRKQGIFMATPGRSLFEWAPIMETLLAPHPQWQIVLSTSWVRSKSFDFARGHLPATLQARVIGATFHRREMRKDYFAQLLRGQQVLLDVHRRRPHDWFAIDDDAEGPPEFLERLIQTDPELGLSDPAVQRRIGERLAAVR